MKLTFDQLAAITRGADHTLVQDDRFVMRRCTDAQTAVYARTKSDWKCRSSVGIRFDFVTDSQTICFDYTVRGIFSVGWVSIELYADGVMVDVDYHETYVSFNDYSFSYRFADRATRRITIYLPYMVDVQLHGFTLDDGASLEPYTAYAGKMLCFGDSITHGYHARYSSCTYPAIVARYFNFDFNNQGNAGYIFDAATIDPELNFSPDLITVAFGTNDWGRARSREQFISWAETYFDRLHEAYPNIPVVAVLPSWRVDSWRGRPAGTFEEARALLADIIREHGCQIADGGAAVPHLPEFFGDLRLHPNDMGFAFYAQEVIRAISALRDQKR